MTTAFTWLLHASDGWNVRFILVGNVAITSEHPTGSRHPEVTAWVFDTADQACDKLLRRTGWYEGEGFTLVYGIRAAEVDTYLPGLAQECEIIVGEGPILKSVLGTLLSPDATVLS